MLSVPQVTLAAQGCGSVDRFGRLHSAWQPREGRESGGVHCPVHSGASHWNWAWKSLGPDKEQCSRAEAGKASHAEPRLRRECQEEAAHKRGLLESPAWVKGQWPRSNRLLFPCRNRAPSLPGGFSRKAGFLRLETCYLQKSKNQPAKQKSCLVQQDMSDGCTWASCLWSHLFPLLFPVKKPCKLKEWILPLHKGNILSCLIYTELLLSVIHQPPVLLAGAFNNNQVGINWSQLKTSHSLIHPFIQQLFNKSTSRCYTPFGAVDTTGDEHRIYILVGGADY